MDASENTQCGDIVRNSKEKALTMINIKGTCPDILNCDDGDHALLFKINQFNIFLIAFNSQTKTLGFRVKPSRETGEWEQWRTVTNNAY